MNGTTDTGLQGYDRYIFYAYAPLGAVVDLRAGERTTVTLAAQYNLFLGGDSESKTSALGAGVPDIEVEFEDGSGWEFSSFVNRRAGRGTVSFGPFLRIWDLDQSTSQIFSDEEGTVEFVEPPNRTTEFGLKLAYRF